MGILDETVSEQFARWEQRGRGWRVWPYPVCPEPPFKPFLGFFLPEPEPDRDDGRKRGLLASVFDSATKLLNPKPQRSSTPAEPPEPEAEPLERDDLVELQALLPAELDIAKDAFALFFTSVSLAQEPIGFELLSASNRVTVQFIAHPKDVSLLTRQLHAHFSEVQFQPHEGVLKEVWDSSDYDEVLVIEFGLAREFMSPLLTNSKFDPYIGIVGALSELNDGEIALFQVLFQSAENPWPESIRRAVAILGDKPTFANKKELVDRADEKLKRPLFAAVVRVVVKSATAERTLSIARNIAACLRGFASSNGNELIPLSNEDYPFESHVEDLLRRQSRRTGMLLNTDELAGFVHLPSDAVRSPSLQRQTTKSKAAPAIVHNAGGIFVGNNLHYGQTIPVRLTSEQRVRHCHIIGVSGTGKSTLLFNLIRQDIQNGEGIAVLDPHGDLVDRILGIIPPERIQDVVLVDPSDEHCSVGFNILSAHSDHEKTLLASDLVSVFQRLSTSWGDQMQSVLQNAVRAFLNSNRGGTLADLRRFLIEPTFRNDFLKSVSDSGVLYYWQKGFAQLTGNKSIGPVLTRLETLLAQKPIEHMVSQPTNRLDFGHIMDSGKIFLAKLPEGLLGKENSYLVGALLVSKFQQLVMSRQAKQVAARRDYWIYIDEFANFITPTMAEILSGARKYRIGLTLAHHELHQLQRNSEVASAVMAHPFTRVVFRVGDDDAKKLAEGFSFFEAKDFKNLEAGHAIARVERSNFDFNLSVPLPEQIDESIAAQCREEVIQASRKKYGTPRAEVEAMLLRAWEAEQAEVKSAKLKSPRPSKGIVAEIEIVPSSPKKPVQEKQSGAPDSEKKAVVARAEPTAQISPPSPSSHHPSGDIPVITGSEKKIAEVLELANQTDNNVVSKRELAKEPAAPRELGRGGAEHKAIQKQIKEAGEALNFRSIIEHQVLDGENYVDVWLERNGYSIACEISVESPLSWEVDKVAKFIKAGFEHIVFVSTNPAQLDKLSGAIAIRVGTEDSRRVQYYEPAQFIASLKAIEQVAPTAPTQPETRRGRKIVRKFTKVTAQEARQREEDAIQALRETMKTKSE